MAAGSAAATDAALEVLRRGGNAIDAAICAAAVQCVVEFPWCGLGGDAFWLIRTPTGEVTALNGSGAAPGALGSGNGAGHAEGAQLPRFGPLSVAVPGFVDALCTAAERFGTLPLADLLAPAVAYARDGFALSPDLSRAITRVRPTLANDDPLAALIDANATAAAQAGIGGPRGSAGPAGSGGQGGSVGNAGPAGGGGLGGNVGNAGPAGGGGLGGEVGNAGPAGGGGLGGEVGSGGPAGGGGLGGEVGSGGPAGGGGLGGEVGSGGPAGGGGLGGDVGSASPAGGGGVGGNVGNAGPGASRGQAGNGWFRQGRLAETLEAVASGGRDAFYGGATASALVAAVRAGGGLLALDDLAGHAGAWVEPLSARYRGVTVYTQPPVSLGCVMLQQLRMYERLDLGAPAVDDPARIDAMVRCKHAAFADALATLGDDPHAAARAGALLADEHVERRCEQLYAVPPEDLRQPAPASTPAESAAAPASPSGSPASPPTPLAPESGPGAPPFVPLPPGSGSGAPAPASASAPASGSGAGPGAVGGDTTCLTVMDDAGWAVTVIHSLFNEFGSRVYEPATGVLLNDRLANQVVGTGPNRISGGRRPLHTLNTFLVTRDGRPALAGATPGGRGQVQINFQVIVNAVDLGMDTQEAIDSPRWLSGAPRRPAPNQQLYLEPGLGESVGGELRRLGHDVRPAGPDDTDIFGSVVVVGSDSADGTGGLLAAADNRREATAAGL